MSLGRRKTERQAEFWVATGDLAGGPGHLFYDRLNRLLDQAGFDRFVEELCAPHYEQTGRRSIPPGRYFRMLLVGYFEGIDSQRGIAWRCADSLSLRRFLFLELHEESPDHSSLTNTRNRLPTVLFEQVFAFVFEPGAGAEAAQGRAADGGGRLDDAGGQRGDEGDHSQGFGRRLEGVPEAVDAGRGSDRRGR